MFSLAFFLLDLRAESHLHPKSMKQIPTSRIATASIHFPKNMKAVTFPSLLSLFLDVPYRFPHSISDLLGLSVLNMSFKDFSPPVPRPGLYRSEFRSRGLKPGQRTLLIHLREWIHLDLVGRLTLSKDGNKEIQEIPMVGHPDMGTRNLKTPRI
jgi:hypothetical protein